MGQPAKSAQKTSQRSVLTFVTPAERDRVDAAGLGCYTTMHRENLDQVLNDLRTTQASAVIVSVTRYQQQHSAQMARLVREFPRVPAVALLTANEARSTQALLSLGHNGVRKLVDARDPAGWRDLRQIVAREGPGPLEIRAISCLRQDLSNARRSCLVFFEALFSLPPSLTTVRQLARVLNVRPTTFMSRFIRHGLPTPKKYLALARLVRAAGLLDNPGYSVTQAALLMEYSSPQSFSRHLRATLHLSAAEFRTRHSGESMLHEFRARMILPYQRPLQIFEPFDTLPPWITAPSIQTARTGTNSSSKSNPTSSAINSANSANSAHISVQPEIAPGVSPGVPAGLAAENTTA